MIKTVEEAPVTKAVGVKGKYWTPGDTIRIKFLNGTSALQQKVQQYAAEWLDYADLYFKYVGVNDNAEVKIGFDLDSVYLSSSTIGRDCRAIPQDQPSLNFVYLDAVDATEIKAEVLKGFGHVLGLGIEHKNPNSTIKFKGTDQQFLDEFNLSGSRLDEFKTLYTTSQTNYTEYDKNSIMMVTIPRSFVTAPPLATTRNTELSEKDKAFITDLYPKAVITMTFVPDASSAVCIYILCDTSHVMVTWGDGTRQTIATNQYHYHSYNRGAWKIQFFGTDMTYKQFYCDKGLTKLDVTGCKGLQYLWCWSCNLTELDVSKNVNLIGLNCKNNKLSSLDLSHNIALRAVNCQYNLLRSLNLTNNLNLLGIDCGYNQLTDLDLSHNDNLDSFECCDNLFVRSDVSLKQVIGTLPNRTGLEAGMLILNDTAKESIVRSICQEINWRFERLTYNYVEKKTAFRNGAMYLLELNRMPARRD